MNSEIEDFKKVISVLVNARKKGWGFLTMKDFKNETDLEKSRVLEILTTLKKAAVINFSFLSFDDPAIKKSIFDPNRDDIQDPTGAVSFTPDLNKPLTKKVLRDFGKGMDEKKLQDILDDEQALKKLLNSVSYSAEVKFDEKSNLLLYKDLKIQVSAGNQAAICHAVFSAPIGTELIERDVVELIEEYLHEGIFTTEQIQNAMYPINKKFAEATGLKDLIKFKKGRIWASIEI
jgi:hypothetical protein